MARPGQTIKVTTHFFGKPATQSAKADAKGQWLVSVKTPKAGYKPYSITFDDGRDVTTVSHVLVGEVWVCAGQSNMEMPMKASATARPRVTTKPWSKRATTGPSTT